MVDIILLKLSDDHEAMPLLSSYTLPNKGCVAFVGTYSLFLASYLIFTMSVVTSWPSPISFTDVMITTAKER